MGETRDTEWSTMREVLSSVFGDPSRPLDDEAFGALALRSFALQFEGSTAYRRFCRGRGLTPETVTRWEEIPAVPATAFKHLDLFSAPGQPEATFITSGTTRGRERRGRHPVLSLDLYRQASVPWFGRNLIPEGGRLPVLSLVPDPTDAPSSSLSTMMGFVTEAFGAPGSGFFAGSATGVDHAAFTGALRRSEAGEAPVLLMGTAFAWVHWLEEAEREGLSFRLPEGSRLMETGGFKGLSRVVPREQLYGALSSRLGIPRSRMVNEYGMTELLSQLYEPVLAEGEDVRAHRPPPWLRVRPLDPETLAPRPQGGRGILAFLDLANLGSVSAILTEDVGWVDEAGVHLEGRVVGAEPRGCSLAMEELLGGGR